MKKLSFDVVANSIASMLPNEKWQVCPSARGTMRLRATDVLQDVEHHLILTEPFAAVDEPGGLGYRSRVR